MKIKFLIFVLICVFFFSSCARQKHKVIFQSPFPEAEKETWGYPLPQSSFQITSPFGELRRRENTLYRHQGIDIKVEQGTPVLAVQKGRVVFTGKSAGYGLLVCIEHAGQWETRYAHLSSILVKKGSKVNKGQMIGKVGTTGNATGPHLHFELRKNGVPINPITLIPMKR